MRRGSARLQIVPRVRSAPAAAVQGTHGGGKCATRNAPTSAITTSRWLAPGKARGQRRSRMPRAPNWTNCSESRARERALQLRLRRLSSFEKTVPAGLPVERLAHRPIGDGPAALFQLQPGCSQDFQCRLKRCGRARSCPAQGRIRPLADHDALAGGPAHGLAGHPGRRRVHYWRCRPAGNLRCNLVCSSGLVIEIQFPGCRPVILQQLEPLQVLRVEFDLRLGLLRWLAQARAGLALFSRRATTGTDRAP